MGRVRRLTAGLLLVGALGLSACGGGGGGNGSGGTGGTEPAGPPAAATVNLKPSTFSPEDVTVKVGETVRWKWGGGVQHDVEGDGFKSKLQAKGSYDHTFDTAGTYDFKCSVHPTTMKGKVTVEA